MDVKLECPICLHSLFESALVEDETRARGESSGPSVKVKNKSPKKFSPLNGNAGSKSNSLSGTCVTPCGHLFHSLCLQHWFKGGKEMVTCPSCRKAFRRNTIIQLFMDACARESPTLNPMPILSPRPSSVSFLNGGSDLKNGGRRKPELVVIPSSDEENNDLLPTLLTNAIKPESDIAGANNATVTVSIKNKSKLDDWKAAYDKLKIDYNGLRRRCRALEDESNFRGTVLASLGLEINPSEHFKAKSRKSRKYEDVDDEDKSYIMKLSPDSAQRKRKAGNSGKSGRDGKKRKY